MDGIKEQLKPIILKSLRITDVAPEDMRDDAPLVGGPVEIDSIDILQLILEIERHFGIRLVKGKFDKDAWLTINSLAATIEARLVEAGR
jgi:acyl carrier protein